MVAVDLRADTRRPGGGRRTREGRRRVVGQGAPPGQAAPRGPRGYRVRPARMPKDIRGRVRGVALAPNGHHPELRRAHTDYGNAEGFVDEHRGRVRWCGPWGKWLIFDGKRWLIDDLGEVERLMKITVRGIYAEA